MVRTRERVLPTGAAANADHGHNPAAGHWVATEALARVDLLEGLKAIAIDEVKYNKGHRYLTVVCDHDTGKVVWAHKGRKNKVLESFLAKLGEERAAALEIVTCDGASWIHDVVKVKAPNAQICLDTFHVISWVTKGLDEVRRDEWNRLRREGKSDAAKALKGTRWLLLRNWANLKPGQKGALRDLHAANQRLGRAWELKEDLVELFKTSWVHVKAALDEWLAWASRSKLAPFVKLARTIREFRTSILATIEYGYTNGLAESNNASIGRLRASARGFQDPEAFIQMIMLDRAGLTPTLPWAS